MKIIIFSIFSVFIEQIESEKITCNPNLFVIYMPLEFEKFEYGNDGWKIYAIILNYIL